MSMALADRIVAAVIGDTHINYGPWRGYRSAVPSEEVGRDYITSPSLNFLYVPRYGYWRRRSGYLTRFDDSLVGLLPAHWNAKARHLDALTSPSLADNLPTPACLFTKETINSGLDDGKFGQFWVRDQVASVNYTLGSEYGTTHYPLFSSGSVQRYKGVPLWYDSGDGGLTRGTTEFARRFLTPGGRRWLTVGNWTYFPNLNGTPIRWNRRFNPSTSSGSEINRWIPTGPLPPLWCPIITEGTAANDGPWSSGDRFYVSVAFRFEDGSIGQPCVPRVPQPNGTLPAGFGLVTLSGTGPKFDKITWSNIPIGPNGTIGRVLLRTKKIDANAPDTLALNPFDLRIVYEIKDNTTTSYEDFAGDDLNVALTEVDKLLVHFNHSMPPRARYIAGGDQRIIHTYCAPNPCAIVLAPVGLTADYDLNWNDESTNVYTANDFHAYLSMNTSGDITLSLVINAATATISLTTYNTLQKLVDKINASSIADTSEQWRAQICPGVNPDAECNDTLTPHARVIANCVTTASAATITNASGGLSKVAVGSLVTDAGSSFPAGTYVLRVDSDTQVTMSAAATAGAAAHDVTFYFDLGDAPGGVAWAQRIIAGSLPGFLYFNNTYLDQFPVDKSSVWMTTAGPGLPKSAANSWVNRFQNKHTPPGNPGISMGGGASGNGFVLPFANAVYVLRNTVDGGTGIDSDYQLRAISEREGCCAWGTVGGLNDFVHYVKPGGLYCADLNGEALVSEDVHLRSANLTSGDLNYEIGLSMAATAADADTSTMHARSLRDAIWLSARRNSNDALSRSQLCYDHSLSRGALGVRAALREDLTPWGWSALQTPNVFGCMGAVVRSDGLHLYTMDDGNIGSVGDGRICEFETGNNDDGSEISSEAWLPLERLDDVTLISPQEVTVLHRSLTGASPQFYVYRGRDVTSDFAVLTLSTHVTGVAYARDIVMMPMGMRAPSDAFRFRFYQEPDDADPCELRFVQLRAKKLPSYT